MPSSLPQNLLRSVCPVIPECTRDAKPAESGSTKPGLTPGLDHPRARGCSIMPPASDRDHHSRDDATTFPAQTNRYESKISFVAPRRALVASLGPMWGEAIWPKDRRIAAGLWEVLRSSGRANAAGPLLSQVQRSRFPLGQGPTCARQDGSGPACSPEAAGVP